MATERVSRSVLSARVCTVFCDKIVSEILLGAAVADLLVTHRILTQLGHWLDVICSHNPVLSSVSYIWLIVLEG